MTESKTIFFPSNVILNHYDQKMNDLLLPPDEVPITLQETFESRFVKPLLIAVEKAQSVGAGRAVTIETDFEGRSGFQPRANKLRNVRLMLSGRNPLSRRIDTQKVPQVKRESFPEEISIHLFVDTSPLMLSNPDSIRNVLAVLRLISDYSPDDLNNLQKGLVIKKINLSVDVFVGTVDGNRIESLGSDHSTKDLLADCLRLVRESVHLVDDSEHPRLRDPAKALDILNRSHAVFTQQANEPHIIHHYILLQPQKFSNSNINVLTSGVSYVKILV